MRRQRTFRVVRDGLLQLTERHVRGDHQRRLRHERPFLLPNLNLQPKLGGFAVRLVFSPPPSTPLEHRRRRKHLPQRRVHVRRAEGRPRDSREPTHEVFIEHVRVDGPEINGPLSLLTAATAAAATRDVPRVRPAAVAQLREKPAEVGGKAAGERVDGHARHDHRRETGDAGAAAHRGHDRVAEPAEVSEQGSLSENPVESRDVHVVVVHRVLRLAPPARVHRHALLVERTGAARGAHVRLGRGSGRIAAAPGSAGAILGRGHVPRDPRVHVPRRSLRIRDGRRHGVRVRGGLTRGEGAPSADVHAHALGVERAVVARGAVQDLLPRRLLLLVGDFFGLVRAEAREADARGCHLDERGIPRAARVHGVAGLTHGRPVLQAFLLGPLHDLREQQALRSSLLEHLEAYPLDRPHADALLHHLQGLDRGRFGTVRV